MKKLLATALVLMVACSAMAQIHDPTNTPTHTRYSYEGCVYRLGVLFSDDPDYFEVSFSATNYDYTQFIGFYMHLVAINCPEMISAYEMNMSGLPAGAIVSWQPIEGSGWTNIGTLYNQIATFGIPQPNYDGVTHLGRWNIIALTGGVESEVLMGPSFPSSIARHGPAAVVNGKLWRMNYTNPLFSGCEADLSPDPTPVLVGTTFGAGVWPYRLATESMSLTNVKALYN